MTLDEELALIRQNKAPVATAPVATPSAPPVAADPYADLPPPQTGRDPMLDVPEAAGQWDVIGASWTKDAIARDVRGARGQARRALAIDMMALLPEETRQSIMTRPFGETGWDTLEGLVVQEAAKIAAQSPEAASQWAGYPLTIEAFDAQITNTRRAQYDEAQAIVDQPGGGFAELAGEMASGIADPVNLFMMPLGVSGGFVRTVASEAALGGIGAGLSLPTEFRTAQELDLPSPDPLMTIGTGALGGAVISGGVYGLAKGLQHGANWWRARHTGAEAAMPADANPAEFHLGVDEAEATLRGEPTVQQAFAPQGATPGTLGDVLAQTDGLRLPGAEALPYNEGATITAIIGVESGGNATARNPSSSATGAGQFIASTWLDMMRRYEPDRIAGLTDNQILNLRNDANLSVKMTAMYARENTAKMQQAGIPTVGPGEVYLAHFMGPGGAIRALQAPLDTPITALMLPKEIAANKGIRFNGKSFADFTAGDLRAWSQRKMRAAYDPNAIADLPSFAPTTRGFTGTGQVRAGDEFTIDVAYEVVDLSSLTRASGNLQPRDRSRIASDAWIADTAARLDPAQLMPSPTADRGTPIVGPDNIIESGNGRFGAIERAYDRHPDRAAAYRAQIEAAGYAVPEGVERPVLIARRTSELAPDQRAQFAVAAQDSGVAVMTPTEVARASSRAMTAPVLAQLDPTKPLADAINGGFVRAALSALPRSARNAMFDASGMLNANGLRQLREAIFARAWPDPDILARYTEGDAGDLKSLLEALDSAAPSFAALKADIEAGLVSPEMDISGYVLDAMRLIGAARDLATATKVPVAKAVAELLDDVDLIEGAVAPLTAALVRRFWKGGKAAAADDVAGFLTRYADDARKAGATGGMFDTPGPRDVLVAIDAKAFGDLPEELGNIRGFARPGQYPAREAAAAADPGPGFDAGASAPDVQAANAEIRAALETPVATSFVPDPAAGRATLYDQDGISITFTEMDAGNAANGRAVETHEIRLPGLDGYVTAQVQRNGGDLYVADIYLVENGDFRFGAASFNALGPTALRDVLRAYTALAPDLRTVSGSRVGGARFEGRYADDARQGRAVRVPISRFTGTGAAPAVEPALPAPTRPIAPDMQAADSSAMRAAAAAEIDALRGQFDDFDIDMPDGTTVTVRDVLDDLDADAQFDAFVQACAIIPGGAQ